MHLELSARYIRDGELTLIEPRYLPPFGPSYNSPISPKQSTIRPELKAARGSS